MSGASADAAPAAAMAGLLVTHGTLGAALKSAAERISGPADDLATFSNEHLSPEELTERFGGHLATLAGTGPGHGRPGRRFTLAAAQRACRGRAGVHLLAGVNLPVLLDFLQKTGQPVRSYRWRMSWTAAMPASGSSHPRPAERHRMELLLFRIDDRLIHGQVSIGWAGPMKPDVLLVVDDEAAATRSRAT